MPGGSNFYKDGGWNIICDLCGAQIKNTEAVKTWDNFYVCRFHKEVRNPQDFLRGVKENMSVPYTRSGGPELDANPHCSTTGRSGVAGYAMSGCAVASGPLFVV